MAAEWEAMNANDVAKAFLSIFELWYGYAAIEVWGWKVSLGIGRRGTELQWHFYEL
jgi:hypothetical protein